MQCSQRRPITSGARASSRLGKMRGWQPTSEDSSAGTVNLFGARVRRRLGSVSCGLNHGGNAADFDPDPECLRPGGSVLGGSGVIAADVEEIIDLIVG
jgi:hypothetical protein